MTFAEAIFFFFMLTTAGAALAIVFSKNVFKAALLLLVALLSIAALFILSFAEFVGVTQILIYAGGIIVLLLFGIMLTSKLSGKPLIVGHSNIVAAVLLGGLTFSLVVVLIGNYIAVAPVESFVPAASPDVLGILLMTDYSLPFELTGIILLIALVGAAVLTSFLKLRRR